MELVIITASRNSKGQSLHGSFTVCSGGGQWNKTVGAKTKAPCQDCFRVIEFRSYPAGFLFLSPNSTLILGLGNFSEERRGVSFQFLLLHLCKASLE